MEKFEKHYSITSADMDVNYNMTPNAILLYFQDCFANYLSLGHLAAFDIVDEHLLWVILDFDYKLLSARPLWAENIKVEVWFGKISSVKQTINFRMYNHQGVPFAEGHSIWAVISSDTKRPVMFKDRLEKVGYCVSEVSMQPLNKSAVASDEVFMEQEYRASVTDLDFNGHVCNRTYLAIATSMAGVDFIETHTPVYLHIKFVHESFYGDALCCKVYKCTESQDAYWHIIVNEQGQEVSRIYSEWKEDPQLQDGVAARIQRPA